MNVDCHKENRLGLLVHEGRGRRSELSKVKRVLARSGEERIQDVDHVSAGESGWFKRVKFTPTGRGDEE